MEKRLIIAIALSIIIIMSFQYFTVKNRPITPTDNVAVATVPPSGKASVEEIVERDLKTPLIEEKDYLINTNSYDITISNIGGAIKGIQLKDYNDLKTQEPLVLVDITNPADYIFALSDASGGVLPGQVDYKIVKKDSSVDCISKSGNFEIIKQYGFPNNKRCIELRLVIKNISSSTQSFTYRIIGGAGITEIAEQDKRYVEVSSKINGKVMGFKRPKKDERIYNPGAVTWADLKNKYFSLILKPFSITKGDFYKENKLGDLVMGVEAEKISLEPGASIENKFILYVGPTSIPVLREQGYGLEETVNYGFFGGITKAIIVTLKFFHRIVKNWGIAIILLSIFLNIIVFPLTMKSFKSMQKMQELHPQMEKLKILHKDNPQKLNKEIMELYKKYNINPLSGCLPMLLQMPIFIALYQALIKAIELRGAHFLWIKDLSSTESIPIPFSFPIIGNTINILPLVMVVAMVLQQKISAQSMGSAITEEQKQQQKMMLIMMPIVFGFVFYNMPSGLVLYWVVNTCLTIVEQGAILKKA